MDLKTYTRELPHGGVAKLAGDIGVSPVYLSQLSARQIDSTGASREPSPELCVKLEAATDRRVMRWDLRPDDWRRIWPELIGKDGAPEIHDALKV